MAAGSVLAVRYALAAAALFAAFALLGVYVSARAPMRLDVESVALRGQATELALFFTALGRWYAIVLVTAIAGALAWRYDTLRAVAIVFVSQLLSQGAVSLLKPLFHRHRPDYWLVHDELGFSYPSGHVVTTIVFYLGLLVVVTHAAGVPRYAAITAAIILGALACGIPWSRLALGAHYLTDVFGGVLFGLAWGALVLAILYAVPAINARSNG